MISSIAGSTTASSQWADRVFSRIDNNKDGLVSRNEFVDGTPEAVSSTIATALFDTLDTESSGQFSQDDFSSAFQQLAEDLQAILIQVQGDGPPPPPPGDMGERADPAAMFAELDTDGDGTVSREEFVAGRPDDVSEEQASALFDRIAGEDADSMTEEQFSAGMPPPPPPGGMASADEDSLIETLLATDEETDGTVSAAELVRQMLAAIQAYQAMA